MSILLLTLMQTAIGISSVIFAKFLQNIIDSAAAQNQAQFFFSLITLVALVATQIILRAFIRRVEEKSRSSIENALKDRLFSEVLKKDYASVTAVHSGEWMNHLTSDTMVCANGVVEILPNVVGMLAKLFGALAMILALEPRFAIILVPGGMAMICLTYAFRKILKRLHKEVQEKDGSLRTFLQEHLESLLIVRAFSAEHQVEQQAHEKMLAHQSARMKKNRFSNLCNIGFSAAMNGMYLLGLAYSSFGILNGTVSYGTLTAILHLISQIQSPFANITGYLPKFYAMTASAERLRNVEDFEDDHSAEIMQSDQLQQFYNEDFVEIAFEKICFSYKKTDEFAVLNDLMLQIKKGDFIALTGHSGCGKSTLFKLLLCLYQPESGRILLSSKNAKSEILSSRYRKLFAYVPQGNGLMSGTIREIVSFGNQAAMQNEAAIQSALKTACADEFVQALENGIDTLLGENGAGLSEGQMQRIAVARAIFSEHPILLLDEATSALDEQTEKNLLENLKQLTNKTVIIVTHRPAALKICNKVITMAKHSVTIEVKT